MKSKNQSWLCARCRSKIDENAYYCRNCDAIVRNDINPGSRIPDQTFGTRVSHIWKRHPIQKLLYLILFIAIAFSATKEISKFLQTSGDNNSSAIFQLQIDDPRTPFTCRLRICHLLIGVINKTNENQSLSGIPYFESSSGKRFGPADPKAVAYPIYFGQYYCQRKLSLKFGPSETIPFIGICTMDIPAGTTISKVYILDKPNGKILVSAKLAALVPPS